MLLKLKAKIYQYTGIYLAQAEENAMINSESAVTEIFMLTKLEYTPNQARGVVIGSWQAHHRLYSVGTGIWVPRNKPWYIKSYYTILNRIVIIYDQFKDDVGL